VDAAFNAIRKATGLEVELEHYAIRAVTGSSQALGEAVLRVRQGDRVFAGRGVSTDIIEASAKAYISALNHLMRFQSSKPPAGGASEQARSST
jgi:2-isopropylmalate synthase